MKEQQQICDAADQILHELAVQCGGDARMGIAALALAMCALARADGTSFPDIKKEVALAHKLVAQHSS